MLIKSTKKQIVFWSIKLRYQTTNHSHPSTDILPQPLDFIIVKEPLGKYYTSTNSYTISQDRSFLIILLWVAFRVPFRQVLRMLIESGQWLQLLPKYPNAEMPPCILQLVGCVLARRDRKYLIKLF